MVHQRKISNTMKTAFKKAKAITSLKNNENKPEKPSADVIEIEEILYESPDLKERISKYGSMKKTLGKGSMFGEKALLQPVNRSASIICLEDSEFIILFKKDFDKVKKYYNKENIERKKFLLSNLPFLNDVTGENLILDFVTNFVPRAYSRGHKLQLEGGDCTSLYLLKEGRLTLEKEITHEMMNEGRPNNKAEYTVPPQKKIKICELGRGALVGDECLLDLSAQSTVFVQSMNCSVYWLDRQLLKFYPKVMISALRKNFKVKSSHRDEYVQSVLKRIRLERDMTQEPISIPTVVAQMQETMQQSTRERLLEMENVERNMVGVVTVNCVEGLLARQTELQDKLKMFYGKFTRKVQYNMLSKQDIKDATTNKKRFFAIKAVKNAGRSPSTQKLSNNAPASTRFPSKDANPNQTSFRSPKFHSVLKNSESCCNITHEEMTILHRQLTTFNETDRPKDSTQKEVGFHIQKPLLISNAFSMSHLQSDKKLRSRQIQKGIIKIKKPDLKTPDLTSFVHRKAMSLTKTPKLSFVNAPGHLGSSFSGAWSKLDSKETSPSFREIQRELFASFRNKFQETQKTKRSNF